MPESGVPSKLIEAIENDTAALLSSRDALVRFELFVRAQRRRGYIDDTDLASLERDIATVRTGVNRKLDYARWARGNPKAAVGDG